MALAIVYCLLSSLIGILQGKYFSFEESLQLFKASQVALVVKNPPAKAGDARDVGLILGLGRSPGAGNGTQLQYSCLENSMNKGAWRSTVHGVMKNWTRLSRHAHTHSKVRATIF